MPKIQCPKCQNQIEFNFETILKGKDFTCANCHTKITISYDSNKDTLLRAKEKLDQLKDELNIN